jgi:hypothetical protein
MKPLTILLTLACSAVFAGLARAASVYIRLRPMTVDRESRAFTITVDRFKDARKGEYLRFNVRVKARPGDVPLSGLFSTDLEVFDGEAIVSSTLLQGTEREGEILYSFLVSAKYTAASKFTFGEILRAPDGEALPSANHYWFYLGDFVETE